MGTDDRPKLDYEEALKRKKKLKRDRKRIEEDNYLSDMEEDLDTEDYKLDQNVLNKLRKR